jgi:hypothetical protein
LLGNLCRLRLCSLDGCTLGGRCLRRSRGWLLSMCAQYLRQNKKRDGPEQPCAFSGMLTVYRTKFHRGKIPTQI